MVIHDAIKLAYVCFIHNWVKIDLNVIQAISVTNDDLQSVLLLASLVCVVLVPGLLLPGPKEAVANPLPNICCLVGGILCNNS